MDKNTLILVALAGTVAYMATRTKTPAPASTSYAPPRPGSPGMNPAPVKPAINAFSTAADYLNTASQVVGAGQGLWNQVSGMFGGNASVRPSVDVSVKSSVAPSIVASSPAPPIFGNEYSGSAPYSYDSPPIRGGGDDGGFTPYESVL